MLFRLLLFLTLLSFNVCAMEITSPELSSSDSSININEYSHLLGDARENRAGWGCNCSSCLESELYVSSDGDFRTGFWARHGKLYRCCLPCILYQNYLAAGLVFSTVVVLLLGIVAWAVFNEVDPTAAENLNPEARSSLWQKPDFEWVLTDQEQCGEKSAIAHTVANQSDENIEFLISEKKRLYYRSFHLLCGGLEMVEQIYCIDALGKSIERDFFRIARLEQQLSCNWLQSESTRVLPRLWSNWFLDDRAEKRRLLCLHKGRVYDCRDIPGLNVPAITDRKTVPVMAE